MPVDFFPVSTRKLYPLSVNRNAVLTMTVKRMPQEEPETKINNYNPVTGFTNKTQQNKTVQNFQQMSVLVPGRWT